MCTRRGITGVLCIAVFMVGVLLVRADESYAQVSATDTGSTVRWAGNPTFVDIGVVADPENMSGPPDGNFAVGVATTGYGPTNGYGISFTFQTRLTPEQVLALDQLVFRVTYRTTQPSLWAVMSWCSVNNGALPDTNLKNPSSDPPPYFSTSIFDIETEAFPLADASGTSATVDLVFPLSALIGYNGNLALFFDDGSQGAEGEFRGRLNITDLEDWGQPGVGPNFPVEIDSIELMTVEQPMLYGIALEINPTPPPDYRYGSAHLIGIDLNTGVGTDVGSIQSPLWGAPGLDFSPDGQLYGAADGLLKTFSLITGKETIAAVLSRNISGQGFAISDEGRIFAATGTRLYKIDPLTGVVTTVGVFDQPVGQPPPVLGMDFAPDGTLYLLDGATDALYIVDPSTAHLDLVGPVGYNFFACDLTIAPDGAFYASAGFGTSPSAPRMLLTLDPSTGAGTVVAEITIPSLPNHVDSGANLAWAVRVNQPPVVLCEDIELALDATGHATLDPADVDNGSYDPEGGPITLSLSQTEFTCADLGDQIVTLTAVDNKGAVARCEATVTVTDVTPPELTVSVTPDCLWPPNHKMSLVTCTVSATDACDSDPLIALLYIECNEADNAIGVGDGNTYNDIRAADGSLTSDDTKLLLRAERAGKGNGRIYTIVYQASDASGNSVQGSATVEVPKNASSHSCGSTDCDLNR